MTEDTAARVIAIMNDHGILHAGDTTGATYLDALGMDSLDTVEIACAIEVDFGVEVPDGWEADMGVEWDQARVSDLVAYVEKLRGATA